MTPERYQKIGKLFDRALEVRPEHRAAWLDKATRPDAELRREVEKLLANYLDSEEFLERPAMDVAAALLASARPSGRRDPRHQCVACAASSGA